jgi:hypothetical protein
MQETLTAASLKLELLFATVYQMFPIYGVNKRCAIFMWSVNLFIGPKIVTTLNKHQEE